MAHPLLSIVSPYSQISPEMIVAVFEERRISASDLSEDINCSYRVIHTLRVVLSART